MKKLIFIGCLLPLLFISCNGISKEQKRCEEVILELYGTHLDVTNYKFISFSNFNVCNVTLDSLRNTQIFERYYGSIAYLNEGLRECEEKLANGEMCGKITCEEAVQNYREWIANVQADIADCENSYTPDNYVIDYKYSLLGEDQWMRIHLNDEYEVIGVIFLVFDGKPVGNYVAEKMIK